MAKFLTLVLALATLGGIAYYVMYSNKNPASVSANPAEVESAPHQQLENVRSAAKRIEADDARRAEEVLKKTEAAESQ